MKRKIVLVTSLLALAAPGIALAQFGNLLGGKAAATDSKADVFAQQDRMVQTYAEAGGMVLTSNGHFSQALGLKAEASNAAAKADSLSGKDLEAQDKAISAGTAELVGKLKTDAKLKDGPSKESYAKGLLSLAQGVKKYMDMSKEAQSFSSGLSSVSPLQMGKLQSGVYVAKTLPGNISNLTNVLKSAVEFGKSNGVQIPKEATSLL